MTRAYTGKGVFPRIRVLLRFNFTFIVAVRFHRIMRMGGIH